MKTLLILLLTTCSVILADTWQSSDGKTITANFVRLQNDTVTLSADGKQYNLPLSRLSKKSQDYARFMQEQMKSWASENLKTPIIAESALRDIVAFDPSLAEGKTFLIEGIVKSISKTSALGSSPLTTAAIELEAGAKGDVNVAGQADGKITKVRIDKDRIVLTKAQTYEDGKWKDFIESETLMEKGQSVVFRANVEKGKISCSAVATEEEIDKAKTINLPRPTELTAEDKAALGRLRMRAAYLEAQLANDDESGDGVLSDPSATFSKAELDAMNKELQTIKKQLQTAEESQRSNKRIPRR